MVSLGETEFVGQTAVRSFAGGQIKFLLNSPQGERITAVRVRFVGFRCLAESDWDQSSGADEPFFIIGVAGTNGSKTVRFGPYENINDGAVKFEATDIATAGIHHGADNITPPIVLGVVAMEHDSGSVEEAETKVRKIIEEMEKKFDQAVAFATGVPVENHVLPEWARDILIGWLPERAAAVFGLDDDEVGKVPSVLFDNKADLIEWRAPAIKGKHGDNEFNYKIYIDGGKEGSYDLFFLVDLVDVSEVYKEREKA